MNEHSHHHEDAGTGRQTEHAAYHAQGGSPSTPAPHIHRPMPRRAGEEHARHGGHTSMIADFRRRFWVSLVLTLPILLLSGQIQQWLG